MTAGHDVGYPPLQDGKELAGGGLPAGAPTRVRAPLGASPASGECPVLR